MRADRGPRRPGARPRASLAATAKEGWVGGRRGAAEAIRSGRAMEVLFAASDRSTPALRELRAEAERAGLSVRDVPGETLDSLVQGHRGVATRFRASRPLSERELAAWAFGPEDVVVVLDGVLDPQNLGAAARAAEVAGAAMLVTRERRSAPPSGAAVRASAGALLHLPHARVANLTRAIGRLKEAGFTVAGLDGSARTSIFDEPCPSVPVALVVGSEGEGMSRLVREACDLLVRLPMRGSVSSLNASAALAAALWAWVLPSRSDTG